MMSFHPVRHLQSSNSLTLRLRGFSFIISIIQKNISFNFSTQCPTLFQLTSLNLLSILFSLNNPSLKVTTRRFCISQHFYLLSNDSKRRCFECRNYIFEHVDFNNAQLLRETLYCGFHALLSNTRPTMRFLSFATAIALDIRGLPFVMVELAVCTCGNESGKPARLSVA